MSSLWFFLNRIFTILFQTSNSFPFNFLHIPCFNFFWSLHKLENHSKVYVLKNTEKIYRLKSIHVENLTRASRFKSNKFPGWKLYQDWRAFSIKNFFQTSRASCCNHSFSNLEICSASLLRGKVSNKTKTKKKSWTFACQANPTLILPLVLFSDFVFSFSSSCFVRRFINRNSMPNTSWVSQ